MTVLFSATSEAEDVDSAVWSQAHWPPLKIKQLQSEKVKDRLSRLACCQSFGQSGGWNETLWGSTTWTAVASSSGRSMFSWKLFRFPIWLSVARAFCIRPNNSPSFPVFEKSMGSAPPLMTQGHTCLWMYEAEKNVRAPGISSWVVIHKQWWIMLMLIFTMFTIYFQCADSGPSVRTHRISSSSWEPPWERHYSCPHPTDSKSVNTKAVHSYLKFTHLIGLR